MATAPPADSGSQNPKDLGDWGEKTASFQDYIEEVHLDTLLPVSGVLLEHLRREGQSLENGLLDFSSDQVQLKRVGCRERLQRALKTVSATLQDLERPRLATQSVRPILALASRMMFKDTLLTRWLRLRLKSPQDDHEERVEYYRSIMNRILEAQMAFEDLGEVYPRLFDCEYPLQAPSDPNPTVPNLDSLEKMEKAAQEWTVVRYDSPNEPFPTFNGDFREWPAFWAQFLALVDANPRLSPILKFKRLLAALTGDAKEKSRMFGFEEANYPAIKRFLEEEYGDPERLLQVLQDQLTSYHALPEPCPYPDFSRYAILAQEFLREVVRHRPGIVQVPEATVYAIRIKLPDGVVRRWEEIARVTPKETQLEALSRLIQDEARIRRTLHLDKVADRTRNPKRVEKSNETKPTAFNFAVQAVVDEKKCPFCEAEHAPDKCGKELQASDRKKLILRSRRCLRCLGVGHMALACDKENLCAECQKPHHTMLHGAGYAGTFRRRRPAPKPKSA